MRKICLWLVAVLLLAVKVQANKTLRETGEMPPVPLDLLGPVITYTTLGQSSCVSTRTFTATITDIDGVNTTPGTKPRVYYKRNGDPNTLAGWKFTEATNNASPFNFVIDYSLLAGGVTSGQTIQYFVVAQDLAATPNLGVGSASTFNLPPASVALTAAAFPVGGAINFYTIVNSLPTFMQVGALSDFSTLTTAGGLFSAINNVGLSGNTTVEIIDPLITENNLFPLNQIQNTGCGVGPVSLVIKPAAGVSATLTGSRANEPIIRILSNNVTIDGSNNGTNSRDLTLTNTNVNGPNVILYGSLSTVPISNSTLKNTNCVNTVNLTSCIVLSDGSVGGNPGYFSNITIQNNNVQKSSIGILCAAVPGSGNGSNVLITGNSLNATAPNQVGLLGIYAEGLDGATISNNNVGNFETTATGPRYGIWLTNNTINTTVSGNTISGIAYSGTGAAFTYGIFVAPAVAASNDVITGNTISGITSSGTSASYGIIVPAVASGGITISKNKISNIKNTNTSGGAFGIGILTTATSSNITVDNNFIFDVAAFGSNTLVRNGYGIYLGAGGGYKIYYNSVAMNANQTNTVGLSSAMMINGVSTAASVDMRNNIFANMQTAGAPAAARYSIYSANANTIFTNIDYNNYYTAGTTLGFLGSARLNLADIIAGFSGNTNSVNVLPNFVSTTDLHLTTANCVLDNRGTPVSVTKDIDAASRDAATPDIGADEFSSLLSGALAGIVSTAVCENKAVSAVGTNYVTPVCDLIAKVLPAGANPVTGVINSCVTVDATQQYFNGEPYVKRHYDIEPATNAASATATVSLYFTNQEFIDYNTINGAIWPKLPTAALGNADPARANVRVTQFHGTPTGGLPTTTPGNYTGVRVLIDPLDTDITWNGVYWEVKIPVNGFSGFYLHSTLFNTPLPITVNYLTGRKQGSDHVLSWKVTCTTSPRATMILQRSADGRNFNDLYSITADALRCSQPFDHTDAAPLQGMNYYRLKMLDADGKITYSTTVALLNAVTGFDIISIAPNPVVNENFKLNIASAKPGKMEMRIFDIQGRLLSRQSRSLIAGFNSLSVQAGDLAAGTYTIRANMAGEQSNIIRFVKQ